MENKYSRKDFLKTGAAAAAGISLSAAAAGVSSAPAEMDRNGTYTVKIAGRDYCWRARLDNGRLAELARAQNTSTDLWLTRGLVDIQVNGYQGIEITADGLTVEALAACEETLAARGTTRWCPTVTTQDPALIRRVLATIHQAIGKGALKRVLCIHMEANYISPVEGYRGAHIPEYISEPDLEEYESWQKAAGGRIGYFSTAPEIKGGVDFVRYLASKGVLVALAHHNAPYEVVAAAVDAGARLSTHLFNGCAADLNRHHNPVLIQLAEDRLWASFIPDGHHVPYHVLKTGLRAKGLQRSVFTSDLTSLGGKPEGSYTVEGMQVEVKNGGAFLKGTPYLYGAWANLAQGIERATAAGVVTPAEAIRLASTNPARLMGVADGLEPEAGCQGPFVFFREQEGTLKLESIIG